MLRSPSVAAVHACALAAALAAIGCEPDGDTCEGCPIEQESPAESELGSEPDPEQAQPIEHRVPGACEMPGALPEFAVGTGVSCFEPVSEGGTVPIIAGPQGGHHVWISVGCTSCADALAFEFGVIDEATGEWMHGTNSPLQVAASYAMQDGAGWQEAIGLQAYVPGTSWDYADPPAPGTKMILRAAVVGASGEIVHEAEVRAVAGEVVDWDPCDTDPTHCSAD